jgi:hypothetical protein
MTRPHTQSQLRMHHSTTHHSHTHTRARTLRIFGHAFLTHTTRRGRGSLLMPVRPRVWYSTTTMFYESQLVLSHPNLASILMYGTAWCSNFAQVCPKT